MVRSWIHVLSHNDGNRGKIDSSIWFDSDWGTVDRMGRWSSPLASRYLDRAVFGPFLNASLKVSSINKIHEVRFS